MYRARLLILAILFSLPALAVQQVPTEGTPTRDALTVKFNIIDVRGVGEPIGYVKFTPTPWGGVLITPELGDLSPGLHGFHIHQHPNCGPAEQPGRNIPGAAAGGHWDPDNADAHRGPYDRGHKGDLPALYVNDQGRAIHPVYAPRLEMDDLVGHAIVIHQGGDNYADQPEKLGGGGERVACAVVWEN